jgi:hypothetical protein
VSTIINDSRRVLARAVTTSGNKKLGRISTTLAAQQSCPSTCVFRNAGCYAERGPLYAFHVRPMNEHAEVEEMTPIDVALAEAAAINEMDVVAGRPMRLHTVGDCASDEAAEIVADAAEDYELRGGGTVFTYTHGWRDVERESWMGVSVLASCETPEGVREANERGYAAAIVVDEFRDRRKYNHDGVDIIPCPAQTSHTNCENCGLCMKDQFLLERKVAIGFAVHGDNVTKARAMATIQEVS